MLVDDGIETIAGVVATSDIIRPTHFAIGTGSTTIVSGDTALNTETDRNAITSVDASVAKDATFIGDFSSAEISGISLQEFGMFNASSAGSLFNREVVAAIAFVGDRELQLQTTFRFVRSGTQEVRLK